MGFWGTGLYENDLASDVRDSYIDLLEQNTDDEHADSVTCELFNESLDDALFWFALADTQWELGRLKVRVKNKALAEIDTGGGSDLWVDDLSNSNAWTQNFKNFKKNFLARSLKRR